MKYLIQSDWLKLVIVVSNTEILVMLIKYKEQMPLTLWFGYDPDGGNVLI